MTDSRTAKSIRNSYTALFYNIITILLGFFSRKIFIDALGVEVLGLNTTAGNLLGFLNLAELGIGGAVAFTLYSPLAKDDRETINEIVAVQGWLYRRIAYFVLAGSAVLFCCFPIIFDKMELPLWYAYTSFGVLLFSSILGYFVNYRQIILSASQQQYKINNSVQGIKITKTVIQILGLSLLPLGYIFWLVVEFIAAMVTAWSLNRTVKRSYPWLKNNISNGRELLKKHSIVVEKIKQIFFHKIGGFALSQTSPIIIYAYISLSMVAIYGNYMLILSGLWLLNGALNDGIGAGVGNLVAEGNRERIMLFFREFTASRYCFATILSLCLLLLTTPFMSIWFGEEYLLDNTTFYIIIGYAFVSLTRTNDAFIGAYGLFGDIWSPVIEAAINIGLSILLGYYFGLAGIVAGVLASLVLVIACWKPYYLFTRGFRLSIWHYIRIFGKNIALVAISGVICLALFSYTYKAPDNIVQWFVEAVKALTLCSVVCVTVFQLLSRDFRLFTKRVKAIVKL
ncbi:MAG: sugar transporter [Rikenellaceae bacterium]